VIQNYNTQEKGITGWPQCSLQVLARRPFQTRKYSLNPEQWSHSDWDHQSAKEKREIKVWTFNGPAISGTSHWRWGSYPGKQSTRRDAFVSLDEDAHKDEIPAVLERNRWIKLRLWRSHSLGKCGNFNQLE
jgi:hypothetical protein